MHAFRAFHTARPAWARSLGKSVLYEAPTDAPQPPDAPKPTTLTAKAQTAKDKWLRSEAAQSRMRDRLKDASLAGWQRRKIELKLKLGGEKWAPEKKIATSSMEKIRLLNSEFPQEWPIKRLSEQFKISQESVRRILKSKFRASQARTDEREQHRQQQIHTFKKARLSHAPAPQTRATDKGARQRRGGSAV
ncbi:Required for respiratory growth protein 9 mitochondrial [Coemansia sp. RSA 2706]|nr:Required for respiratory growth protein 9 mitochondrial [Coemansia sp. RSA 2708]KAJ2294923.1 Required for respiratory growth protein 9 mitochondrial [Coemansia sp. RSA 2706]